MYLVADQQEFSVEMIAENNRRASEDALRAAERAVIAGVAFRLAAIDEHRITVDLFDDPAYRLAFIGLQVFHKQNPSARQASPPQFVQFISSTPELCGSFSNEILSLDEIPTILETGNFDASFLEGNVETLREAAFRREFSERFARFERLPRDRCIRELTAFVRELEAGNNSTLDPRDAFKLFTAAELDAADFPQRDLIERAIVEGQPCIVAAPKKSLKTNVMIDAALSLASGSEFLGEYWVPEPRRVALLSGESGEATIQETARRIAKSKPSVNLAAYRNAVFGFNLPNFGDDKAMQILRKFIREYGVKVLIVDPAYLCLPLGDDAGNLFKVGQILMPFSRMAQDEDVTPIIVHHFVKAAAITTAPPELEHIAWAGFQEWARQWILMSRRSPYNADRPGRHELWFAAGGSAGHSEVKALDIDEGSREDSAGRKWDVVVKSVGEAVGEAVDAHEQANEQRAAVKDQRQRAKDLPEIRNTLRSEPAGLTFTKLRKQSGVKDSRLRSLLTEMERAGEIIHCKITASNKQEYDGYRLSPVPPVTPVSRAGDTSDTTDTGSFLPL